MKSTNRVDFATSPVINIPRSRFVRSFGRKQTFFAGLLTPFMLDEAIPGDTFKIRSTFFIRILTLLFPLMDNIQFSVYYYSVPFRLVWENWEKFMGEQVDPGDSIDFTIPVVDHTVAKMSTTGVEVGTLEDYWAINIDQVDIQKLSCLPTRAYCLIWNNDFRDQNLQDSIVVPLGNGPDALGQAGRVLRRVNKKHDYFTSCLPFPGMGSIAEYTDMPLLLDNIPVVGNDGDVYMHNLTTHDDRYLKNVSGAVDVKVNAAWSAVDEAISFGKEALADRDQTGLEVNLQTEIGLTVDTLRQSIALKRLLEKDGRGGRRYPEIIRMQYGVSGPLDQILERPEYLGGGKINMRMSPVANTSESGAIKQGDLTATGTASGTNIGFTKSFTEHCMVLGFIAARADLTYQQGTPRMLFRQTRYDFFFPELQDIGEQPVYQREIWTDSITADATPNVFGYQERYAEYRYKPSEICGLFRSDAAGTLHNWHLAQDFAAAPALDTDFIEEFAPMPRVTALGSGPEFKMDSFHEFVCARPMKARGIPGLSRI